MPAPRSAFTPRRLGLRALCMLFALLAFSGSAAAQSASRGALGDAEFWDFFVKMSEPDGSFLSDNFVSNEMGFQEVIPSLQRSLTGDVYLGVGPEQNFTYIANLKPRLAVIFDIRRQNAMQHLMYKALFELSPTRAGFVSMLFSRPAVAGLSAGIPVKALFDSAEASSASDSAFEANRRAIFRQLRGHHGFALSADDSLTIDQVYRVFFIAGPSIHYGFRAGMTGGYRLASYPTFGMLQAATNSDSVQMAFLASDEHYEAVRDLQIRNLVVPVVADFGGPTALRAVGEYLRKQRLTVGAFYVSNVEQYLFRDSAWERFYANVSALPFDSASAFIRSVPRSGNSVVSFAGAGGAGTVSAGIQSISVTVIRDSGGIRTITTSRDSAGQTITQTTRDSAGAVTPLSPADTSLAAQLRGMMARRDSITRANQWAVASGPPTALVMGGLLTSGLASIRETVDAFFMGQLKDYRSVIAMTRTTGWQ